MDKDTFNTITNKAKTYLDEGYHCSESTLLAVGTHYLEKVDPIMLRLASPFGGGVGRTREQLCGALAGGIMLIGALYGRADAQTNDDLCMELTKEFRMKFYEEFGYIQCRQLKDNWVGKPGQESCSLLVAKTAGVLIDTLENVQAPF